MGPPIYERVQRWTVLLYSMIVGADHRRQMITWQRVGGWAKLLFHKLLKDLPALGNAAITKRSDFCTRKGAFQVAVWAGLSLVL